jgi:hypothetical protein
MNASIMCLSAEGRFSPTEIEELIHLCVTNRIRKHVQCWCKTHNIGDERSED